MKVKNYYQEEIVMMDQEKTLGDAIREMTNKKSNSVIVIDQEQKPIGIVSSHLIIDEIVPAYLKQDDISVKFDSEGVLDKYTKQKKDKKIKEIMVTDFPTLDLDDPMILAAAYSDEETRRIVPVVDAEGKLIGAITRTNIKKALYDVIFNGADKLA